MEILLEWVTATGNRYELPITLDETLETLPFEISAKLGTGHLELNGERLTSDMEPPDNPVRVNVRLELLARGLLPERAPTPPEE
jgi:hypothetical protein